MFNFTVVIPLYNKDKSILSTVTSVLNQTYVNFEIIVVNDGSTDNSFDVVNTIHDNRLRIINKKNGGVSSARNIGIKEAKYDYIAFLDGDDLWKPQFLMSVIAMIDKYPHADIISTGWIGDDDIDSILYKKEGYIDNYFKISLFSTILCSSSVVIKRVCFEKIGGFREDLSYGEDLEMWSRLAKKFIIAYQPQIMSIYKYQSENRACLQKRIDVRKHYGYHISISNSSSLDEIKYKNKIIRDTILYLMIMRDFNSLKILSFKYGFFKITSQIFLILFNYYIGRLKYINS